MARVPKTVSFQVRPANRGLNGSVPPQTIDLRESPNLMNIRFMRGTIQHRNGFTSKYIGLNSPALYIDTVWSSGDQNVIAVTEEGIFYKTSSGHFLPCDAYDGSGSPATFPIFNNMQAGTDPVFIDVGTGRYEFLGANGGTVYPSASGWEDISVIVNGTSDGIWIAAYTAGSTPVEVEKCESAGCPSSGSSVAIFDSRVFIGGTGDSPNEIVWSAIGDFHTWDPAEGGGSQVLADSPDWIKAMFRLGEYLIVYKERSIYIGSRTLTTDPPVRFQPAPGQGIGLAAPASIGDLGEEHIFLGWDDVYVFSLRSLQPIGSRIKDFLFYGEYGILPKYLNSCIGAIAEEFNEYWLFVPTGAHPETSTGEDIPNLISNPKFTEGSDGSTPTDWTVVSSGDGTAILDADGGGTFAPGAMDLTFTSGTLVTVRSSVYDYEEVITGREFSAVVWLSTPDALVEYQIWMTTSNSDGSYSQETTKLTGTITSDDGVTRVVLSATIAYADAERIALFIKSETADATLEVHAAHMVRIDNVDDIYVDRSSGYGDLGYVSGGSDVIPYPLIADRIGQWMPDTCWVFNYEVNSWAAWRLPMSGFGYDSLSDIKPISSLEGTIEEQAWRYDEKLLAEFAPTNLVAQVDGNIYEISRDVYEDWGGVLARPYLAFWESKDFDLDSPTMDKTFSRLVIYHETSHAATTVTVSVSTDSGATAWQSQDVTIRSGEIQTFADFFVTGQQIRFRVEANSPGFFITGFAVKIIPRGEAHAY